MEKPFIPESKPRKAAKPRFGSGLWVSLMLQMEEFQLRTMRSGGETAKGGGVSV